jgi:hypothetical protein
MQPKPGAAQHSKPGRPHPSHLGVGQLPWRESIFFLSKVDGCGCTASVHCHCTKIGTRLRCVLASVQADDGGGGTEYGVTGVRDAGIAFLLPYPSLCFAHLSSCRTDSDVDCITLCNIPLFLRVPVIVVVSVASVMAVARPFRVSLFSDLDELMGAFLGSGWCGVRMCGEGMVEWFYGDFSWRGLGVSNGGSPPRAA